MHLPCPQVGTWTANPELLALTTSRFKLDSVSSQFPFGASGIYPTLNTMKFSRFSKPSLSHIDECTDTSPPHRSDSPFLWVWQPTTLRKCTKKITSWYSVDDYCKNQSIHQYCSSRALFSLGIDFWQNLEAFWTGKIGQNVSLEGCVDSRLCSWYVFCFRDEDAVTFPNTQITRNIFFPSETAIIGDEVTIPHVGVRFLCTRRHQSRWGQHIWNLFRRGALIVPPSVEYYWFSSWKYFLSDTHDRFRLWTQRNMNTKKYFLWNRLSPLLKYSEKCIRVRGASSRYR